MHTHTYDWITIPYNRTWHIMVNQLYSVKKKKKKKKNRLRPHPLREYYVRNVSWEKLNILVFGDTSLEPSPSKCFWHDFPGSPFLGKHLVSSSTTPLHVLYHHYFLRAQTPESWDHVSCPPESIASCKYPINYQREDVKYESRGIVLLYVMYFIHYRWSAGML